jgi:hypothetical protein
MRLYIVVLNNGHNSIKYLSHANIIHSRSYHHCSYIFFYGEFWIRRKFHIALYPMFTSLSNSSIILVLCRLTISSNKIKQVIKGVLLRLLFSCHMLRNIAQIRTSSHVQCECVRNSLRYLCFQNVELFSKNNYIL